MQHFCPRFSLPLILRPRCGANTYTPRTSARWCGCVCWALLRGSKDGAIRLNGTRRSGVAPVVGKGPNRGSHDFRGTIPVRLGTVIGCVRSYAPIQVWYIRTHPEPELQVISRIVLTLYVCTARLRRDYKLVPCAALRTASCNTLSKQSQSGQDVGLGA